MRLACSTRRSRLSRMCAAVTSGEARGRSFSELSAIPCISDAERVDHWGCARLPSSIAVDIFSSRRAREPGRLPRARARASCPSDEMDDVITGRADAAAGSIAGVGRVAAAVAFADAAPAIWLGVVAICAGQGRLIHGAGPMSSARGATPPSLSCIHLSGGAALTNVRRWARRSVGDKTGGSLYVGGRPCAGRAQQVAPASCGGGGSYVTDIGGGARLGHLTLLGCKEDDGSMGGNFPTASGRCGTARRLSRRALWDCNASSVFTTVPLRVPGSDSRSDGSCESSSSQVTGGAAATRRQAVQQH